MFQYIQKEYNQGQDVVFSSMIYLEVSIDLFGQLYHPTSRSLVVPRYPLPDQKTKKKKITLLTVIAWRQKGWQLKKSNYVDERIRN